MIDAPGKSVGSPPTIKYHAAHISSQESRYVQQVLSSGHMRSGGQFSKMAQEHLRALTGASDVILTGSCTAAMELAALSLDIGPDDEVIVPSFTFSSTATAFARTGARIVLCDVNPSTMMMDAEQVAKVASAQTKVVVPVHYAGHSVPMEQLMQLADAKGWYVVEDAAQGLGASRNGSALGTMGHFGAYSFHETKIAHCGHGGALIINQYDEKTRRMLEACVNRGTNYASFKSEGHSHYEWTGHGSSFDLSDLQAAILTAQLEELPHILETRRKIVDLYSKHMKQHGIPFLEPDGQSQGNGHIFAMIADDAAFAARLIEDGNQKGLGLQSHYKPLHMSQAGKKLGYRDFDCENSADMWNRIVRLPVHPQMSKGNVQTVIEFVRKALGK